MKRKLFLIGSLFLSTVACSNQVTLKNTGGPDEFAILPNKPLAYPKEFSLVDPRVLEKKATLKSTKTVLATNLSNHSALSKADLSLVKKFQALGIDKNVIRKLQSDMDERKVELSPIAESLGLWKNRLSGPTFIVNAKLEKERIENNKKTNRSILEGETPFIRN